MVFHSTFSLIQSAAGQRAMEARLPSRETADEPTQLGDLPRAVHGCCGLAVHDSNFLSTLLILLLGIYLVPYSYPSHW